MSLVQVRIGTQRNGRTAWLAPAAAASYERMVEDGCPRQDTITEAGRTNARQWELWRMYQRGQLVATAAYPGTSKHESGRAIDVDGPTRDWIRRHGARYGWMRDRVAREPWHMEYEYTRDTQLGRVTKPAPLKEVLTVSDIKAILDAIADTRSEVITTKAGVGRLEQAVPAIPGQVWGHAVPDLADPEQTPRGLAWIIQRIRREVNRTHGRAAETLQAVSTLDVSEVDPAALAAAIPDGLATAVADELGRRLGQR